MAAVEAHLLDVILQLAAMIAPVTPKISLEITNTWSKALPPKHKLLSGKRNTGYPAMMMTILQSSDRSTGHFF